jgi:putative peptide zinc metalloprotease protein
MSRFSPDARVIVEQLSRQPERDGVLVGRADLATFLVLPAEAVDVLDDLARGLTVGEAQARSRERHGETPDLESFLIELEARGFVRPAAGEAPPAAAARAAHFAGIPVVWARRLCRVTFLAGGAAMIAAAAAAALDPQVIPGWRAAYFPNDTALGVLWLMTVGVAGTFVHEMAHLVAARAFNVSCRFSISNRLWFVVWETDMTGIWALPKNSRYIPILAGPFVDLATASILILVFAAERRAWLELAPATLVFGRALLFVYLMRVVWQCYVFVRTDFYYAIANFLGCKSLLRDTETLLRDLRSRWLRIGPRQDLRSIPQVERRMLGAYAIVWLAGRVLALSVLVFVQLPLFLEYLMLFTAAIFGSAPSGQSVASAATLVSGVLFVVLFLSGLGMWVRQLVTKKGATS